MRAGPISCVFAASLAFAAVDSRADPADPAASPLGQTGASAAATEAASGQRNAVDFVVGSGGCGNNRGQTIGWQFDVLNEVTVTSMTWFDDGRDGLDRAHEVGIFDPAGELIESTHVIIPAGSAAMLDGSWRVVDIAATTLPVGQSYIVGGFNGQHTECLSSNVTQTVHPGLNYLAATYSSLGTSFVRPRFQSAAVNGFYGVGFQIGLPLDTDEDGIPDRVDNCPLTPNPTQSDADLDGIGDACNDTADLDGDEWADPLDNCPNLFNPAQPDRDGDDIGDECDAYPDHPDNEQARCDEALARCESQPAFEDSDGDGEHDHTDACPNTPPGAEVDQAGCSKEQFCGAVDASRLLGRIRCYVSDWKNDQPLPRVPRDCVVKRGRLCVARQ